MILTGSTYVFDKRTTPKKPTIELIRCMKCNKFGHFVANCKSFTDTCAVCAQAHRSSECTDKTHPKCVNCPAGSDGHPSWSRMCPDFLRRCKDFDAKFPENSIPFYPTDEEWTWAKDHTNTQRARSVMLTQPPVPSLSQPNQLRQTTLNLGITSTQLNDQLPPQPSSQTQSLNSILSHSSSQ